MNYLTKARANLMKWINNQLNEELKYDSYSYKFIE